MLTKPTSCTGCPLAEIGKGFSIPEGTGSLPLLVVGESLGYNEVNDGLPFRPQAQAGGMLHRILQRARINRNSLAMWNLTACQPPSNRLDDWYEYSAINHCRQYFDHVVDKFKPKVILALGALPFKHLTGLEGFRMNISNIRGYVFRSSRYPDILVVPSYHPSFVMRGNLHLMGVLMTDLLKAVFLAQGKLSEGKDYILDPLNDLDLKENYDIEPTIEQAEVFLKMVKNSPDLLVSYDIETEKSAGEEEDELEEYGQTITQIQFSTGLYSGMALPYTGSFIDIAKDILASSNPKSGHNVWDFDNPILRANGFKINGRVDDTMWMQHHFQADIPIGLQYTASFYCLAATTKIPQYIGESLTIKEIVDKKLRLTIRGMDENGNIIPVHITDWHKTENKGQKWIVIRTNSHKQPIYCTPDHKIFVNDGWKLAENVIVGDKLYLSNSGNTDLIHGMILGDSYIGENNQLATLHSTTQLDYAIAKAKNFGLSEDNITIQPNGNGTSCTFYVRIPSYWRNKFYPNGVKRFVPPPSDAALAIWYCDDGSWKKFNNRKSGDGTIALAIKKQYNVDEVMQWLVNEFGNNVRLGNYKSGKQAYIGTYSRDEFFSRIAQYVPPSMYRKLPEKYRGRYNGWLDKQVPMIDFVSAVVKDYRESGVLREYNTRYCITVDHPTHRFYTEGGLVSNCFPFAWKHLSGSNLPFYGIADVTSVQYIMASLPDKMKARGMWDSYDRYVRQLKPVLEKIQVRGLPINVEKQQKFRDEIELLDERGKVIGGRSFEIREELKQYIPDSFEKLNKVEGYKRVPKEVEQAKLRYMIQEGTSNAMPSEEWIFNETGFVQRDFVLSNELSKEELELMKLGVVFNKSDARVERRWVKLLEFNPNSVDQVSDLIKYNGHEELARKLTVSLKRDYDNELGSEFSRLEIEGFKNASPKKDNVSTSKILLKKLAEKTNNKAYRLIVEFKELSKIKGTYIDGYKAIKERCGNPQCNGYYINGGDSQGIYTIKCGICSRNEYRIHTTYTFRPASGQLSSRNPNVQNYPVHSTLAKKFKECIEATEGRVLVSLDYRGFHNKMMGFLAMDSSYLRIASFDTHSFVTGHVVGFPGIELALEMTDEKLVEFLGKIKKQYKKLRDDQIKHVVHGINFGLSEEGCFKRYMEDFSPTREEILASKSFRKHPTEEQIVKLIEAAGKKKVKAVYDVVRGLFPKLFQWQARTIIEADTKGFIQSAYGARRWFFGASQVKYDKFGNTVTTKKGEQAEQALAFPVSNNAHYHMRETMLLLEEMGLNEKFRLINTIHDSLVYEPLVKDADECISEVKKVMERKSEVLKNETMPDGFFCAADSKIGKNMAEMD